MPRYRDKYGFMYTQDEVSDALEGSNMSLDNYLNAKGLFEDRRVFFHESSNQNNLAIQEHKPKLEKISRGEINLPFQDNESRKKLKEGFKEVAGGWYTGGKGQETRVVNYLNEQYADFNANNPGKVDFFPKKSS